MKQTTSFEQEYAVPTYYTLYEEIIPFCNDIVLVEGKKDVIALESLGFHRVYALHVPGVSLRERVEKIALIAENRPVHILTDLDRQGEKMYVAVKPVLQELGVRLSTKLRALLLIYGISHVEGIYQALQETKRAYCSS